MSLSLNKRDIICYFLFLLGALVLTWHAPKRRAMNTKTMRLPPRRVLTPTKRKERDDFDSPTPAKLLKPATTQSQAGSDKTAAPAEPDSSNHLLAGYFAHEYLTMGTLFGQPFDPARSQPVLPVDSRKVTKAGKREEAEQNKGAERSKGEEKYQRYVEVASLLKRDGAHIAGIVNPTQLARFLHM